MKSKQTLSLVDKFKKDPIGFIGGSMPDLGEHIECAHNIEGSLIFSHFPSGSGSGREGAFDWRVISGREGAFDWRLSVMLHDTGFPAKSGAPSLFVSYFHQVGVRKSIDLASNEEPAFIKTDAEELLERLLGAQFGLNARDIKSMLKPGASGSVYVGELLLCSLEKKILREQSTGEARSRRNKESDTDLGL